MRVGFCRALVVMVVVSAGAAYVADGVAALQTADPSCGDDSDNIYVDCGNGTVTDNRTGLVWLQNANCLGPENLLDGVVDWHTAMEFVAGLSDKPATSEAAAHDCGLSDGSSPGEWRLPSVEEWEAMIGDADGDDPGDLDCSPTITSDDGNSCWDVEAQCGNCSFTGVVSAEYRSSTIAVVGPSSAWVVDLDTGVAYFIDKSFGAFMWPVRGAQ